VRDERHLKRLLSEYVRYYYRDRTHLGLNKETPAGRVAIAAKNGSPIQVSPRLGGLHHRYDLAA
jgi:putative transposase